MRNPIQRLGLIAAAAILVGALNVVPAFAQGPYGSGGYSSGGMSSGAPAPAAGSGSSVAPSARPSTGAMTLPGTAGGASTLYMVRAGDTLSRIAARFGTSPLLILLANPGIISANRIFAGQLLSIPSQFTDNDHDADDLGTTFYTVRFGDTLLRIARRFGLSEGALLRANPGIFNPNLIFAGQVLAIPMTSNAAATKGSSASRAAVPPIPPAVMPGAQATPAPAAQTATVNLTAHNLMFNMSTITVPAGAHVVVNFNNQDAGVPHTFSVYTDSSAQQGIFKGQMVTGPAMITYTFTAPSQPGVYFFRCDVHPAMMNGQFVVR